MRELGEDLPDSVTNASSDPLQHLLRRLTRRDTLPHPGRKARLLFQTDRNGLLNACILLAKYPVTAEVRADHFLEFFLCLRINWFLVLASVGVFISGD